ncbi:hypothetical protein IWQ61_002210 [Dispira simplex]|nr:hypothetical protein IWQ61_002210 [Dispira simplex]
MAATPSSTDKPPSSLGSRGRGPAKNTPNPKRRRRGVDPEQEQQGDAPTSQERNQTPTIDDVEEKDVEHDPSGDRKITALGELLDGREFKCRAFQLPNRHRGRYYMLCMDVVRCTNTRDSFVLFVKHPDLVRLTLTEDEKTQLIEAKILPTFFRSRKIPFITARSAFVTFGHALIKKGRPVTDDYYEAEAREKWGNLPPAPAHRHTPNQHHSRRGRSATPDLAGPVERGASLYGEGQSGGQLLPSSPPSLVRGGSVISQKRSRTPIPDASVLAAKETDGNRFPLHSHRDAWLFNLAQSTLQFNAQLQASRRAKPKYWDPHTYVHQVPRNTQPSRVQVEATPLPTKSSGATIQFVNDQSPFPPRTDHKEPTTGTSLRLPLETLAEAPQSSCDPEVWGDNAFPLAVMPGQYQGLLALDRTRFNKPAPPNSAAPIGNDRADLRQQIASLPSTRPNSNGPATMKTQDTLPKPNSSLTSTVTSPTTPYPTDARRLSRGAQTILPTSPNPGQRTSNAGGLTNGTMGQVSGVTSPAPPMSPPHTFQFPSKTQQMIGNTVCMALTNPNGQICGNPVQGMGTLCAVHNAQAMAMRVPPSGPSIPMANGAGLPPGMNHTAFATGTMGNAVAPSQLNPQLSTQLQMQMAMGQFGMTSMPPGMMMNPALATVQAQGMWPVRPQVGTNLISSVPESMRPRMTIPGQFATTPKMDDPTTCGNCHQHQPPPTAYSSPDNDKDMSHAQGDPQLSAMVTCNKCCRPYHPICLNIITPKLLATIRTYPWQCHECKLCTVCDDAGDEASLMICDDCERGWHMACCIPPVRDLPQGRWVCSLCSGCHSCQWARAAAAGDKEQPLSPLSPAAKSPQGHKQVYHHVTVPPMGDPVARKILQQSLVTAQTLRAQAASDEPAGDSVVKLDQIPRVLNTASETFICTYCTSCYGHFLADCYCPICLKTFASSAGTTEAHEDTSVTVAPPPKRRGRKPKRRPGRRQSSNAAVANNGGGVGNATSAKEFTTTEATAEDTDDDDMNMICCDTCDRWVHIRCDPQLTMDKYQLLVEDESAKYNCPLCQGNVPPAVYQAAQTVFPGIPNDSDNASSLDNLPASPKVSPWNYTRGLLLIKSAVVAAPRIPGTNVVKILGDGRLPE